VLLPRGDPDVSITGQKRAVAARAIITAAAANACEPNNTLIDREPSPSNPLVRDVIEAVRTDSQLKA
jgi:hypothetical protein